MLAPAHRDVDDLAHPGCDPLTLDLPGPIQLGPRTRQQPGGGTTKGPRSLFRQILSRINGTGVAQARRQGDDEAVGYQHMQAIHPSPRHRPVLLMLLATSACPAAPDGQLRPTSSEATYTHVRWRTVSAVFT
ncbi:MAG: hypothetical protein IPM94_06980 [bacterium]|nr:hypothetical protein [bacterium]